MSDHLDAIREATQAIDMAHAKRLAAMRAARDASETWRAIAAAAGMTENGVRKALGVGRYGAEDGPHVRTRTR